VLPVRALKTAKCETHETRLDETITNELLPWNAKAGA
jgi:hypothetical protein